MRRSSLCSLHGQVSFMTLLQREEWKELYNDEHRLLLKSDKHEKLDHITQERTKRFDIKLDSKICALLSQEVVKGECNSHGDGQENKISACGRGCAAWLQPS